MYSLIQPTITPIFNTRQGGHSLLVWSDSVNLNKSAEQPFYEYLKSTWQSTIMPKTSSTNFQEFWDKSLHDGILEVNSTAVNAPSYKLNPADLVNNMLIIHGYRKWLIQ